MFSFSVPLTKEAVGGFDPFLTATGRAVIAGGMAIAAAASAVFGVTGNFWIMTAASLLFGVGIGAAMTASYSAAGAVIPPGAHGAGFGVLTSASLVGMASSPFIAGFVGGASLRIVFFVDAVLFAALAVAVRRLMTADAAGRR